MSSGWFGGIGERRHEERCREHLGRVVGGITFVLARHFRRCSVHRLFEELLGV